jgi:hypothetical protein
LLSYERLSKKPLLFKSFTGLTVQEFDDIYNKKIAKKYTNMRYNDYPKEKKIEKETWVEEDHSNLTLKIDFLCF